jgi:hypothetical protein
LIAENLKKKYTDKYYIFSKCHIAILITPLSSFPKGEKPYPAGGSFPFGTRLGRG